MTLRSKLAALLGGPRSPAMEQLDPNVDPLTLPSCVVGGATARRLADAGALVVDVRSPAEFEAGHAPGARNVPHDQLARRMGELGPPSTPIVVYCKSGQRSAFARAELARHGFARVWDAQRWDGW